MRGLNKTVVLLGAICCARSNELSPVDTSEAMLRANAVKIIRPAYPLESQKRGSVGPAIVHLIIDSTGKVKAFKILQAPDEAIARAVQTAVKDWRFREAKIGGAQVEVRGKLTFYYRHTETGFSVRYPREF